jgi:hypothetical protein
MATAKLGIQKYFSRIKTPSNDAEIDFTPIECIEKELAKILSPVLPMWSAYTRY